MKERNILAVGSKERQKQIHTALYVFMNISRNPFVLHTHILHVYIINSDMFNVLVVFVIKKKVITTRGCHKMTTV